MLHPVQQRALLPGGSGSAARVQPSVPRHGDTLLHRWPLPGVTSRGGQSWQPAAVSTGGIQAAQTHTHVVLLVNPAFLALQQSGGRKKASSRTEN